MYVCTPHQLNARNVHTRIHTRVIIIVIIIIFGKTRRVYYAVVRENYNILNYNNTLPRVDLNYQKRRAEKAFKKRLHFRTRTRHAVMTF